MERVQPSQYMRLAQNVQGQAPLTKSIHSQRHLVQQSLYGSVPPNMVLKERKVVFREHNLSEEELKKQMNIAKVLGGAVVGCYTMALRMVITSM